MEQITRYIEWFDRKVASELSRLGISAQEQVKTHPKRANADPLERLEMIERIKGPRAGLRESNAGNVTVP